MDGPTLDPCDCMKITHAQFSNTGNRAANQDAVGYVAGSEDHACFVISDGIGGTRGGELASRLAVTTVLANVGNETMASDEALQTSVTAANDAILARQRCDAEHRDMAATIVALLIDRRRRAARWAHVGDSRLYMFRRGLLIERTRDHSLAEQLAVAGLQHDGVRSNLLSRALGTRDDAMPHVSTSYSIHDGDVFLLCSDGLWQLVSDEVMERCLRLVHTVDDWLALIAREAEERAKRCVHVDNYSALAVWLGNPERVTLIAMPSRSASA